MPDRYIKLPDNLIEEWPEVFSDLKIKSLPVEYLEKLKLEFHDGRIWEISIKSHVDQSEIELFVNKLISALSDYSNEIKKVDFLLDTEQLKLDIKETTKNLL